MYIVKVHRKLNVLLYMLLVFHTWTGFSFEIAVKDEKTAKQFMNFYTKKCNSKCELRYVELYNM